MFIKLFAKANFLYKVLLVFFLSNKCNLLCVNTLGCFLRILSYKKVNSLCFRRRPLEFANSLITRWLYYISIKIKLKILFFFSCNTTKNLVLANFFGLHMKKCQRQWWSWIMSRLTDKQFMFPFNLKFYNNARLVTTTRTPQGNK